MSVPALSGPQPQTPGTPQKTITELLAQWEDLTQAAIAATGDIEGWKNDVPLDKSTPWDPALTDVGLSPCSTRGSRDASQVDAVVYHAPFEHDPHPIADKLTAYWESQGFTVTRTIDWTDPTGGQSVELRADRHDGVRVGLGASNEIVAIDIATECSTDPSIDAWAEQRVQERLDSLPPAPDDTASPTPRATPSALQEATDDDGWVW